MVGWPCNRRHGRRCGCDELLERAGRHDGIAQRLGGRGAGSRRRRARRCLISAGWTPAGRLDPAGRRTDRARGRGTARCAGGTTCPARRAPARAPREHTVVLDGGVRGADRLDRDGRRSVEGIAEDPGRDRRARRPRQALAGPRHRGQGRRRGSRRAGHSRRLSVNAARTSSHCGGVLLHAPTPEAVDSQPNGTNRQRSVDDQPDAATLGLEATDRGQAGAKG